MDGVKSSLKFGREIFSGHSSGDLPLVELDTLSDEIFASYTGPEDGLTFAADNKENNGNPGSVEIAGVNNWNRKDQTAYGICISLYEQHPINMKMSGDPVADAFAICARKNNCTLLIADGVNWGEKSRLAARCALYGSMDYINNKLFVEKKQPSSTQEALKLLRKSFDAAHQTILEKEGGLTTMCACLVLPVKSSEHFAVCCLNVGDSYGYVLSHNHGIREVTVNSHDVFLERDIRDAGGALGPVDGKNPELHNLTYSLTFANIGDIVFLTTDGISDNFDPVVTKIAVPKRSNDSNFNNRSPTSHAALFAKPEMEPRERHVYSMKEMERVINEFELVTEEECSPQALCGTLVQHILSLTDPKRKILENPALYAKRKMTSKDRNRRDSEIVEKMSKAPGKLDHASIVAFEIGLMKPDEDEMENISLQENINGGTDMLTVPSSSHTPTSLTSPTSPGPTSPSGKKSRPKKLFAKIRSLSVNSSPTSPNTSSSIFPISPKRFSFKRSRSRMDSEPETPVSPSGMQPTYPFGQEPFTSPQSPTPMSPSSPDGPRPPRIPIPAQHPCRRSISYESSV